MTLAPRRIGIDVGGTKMLAVALDHDGEIIAETQRPTPRGPGSPHRLIDALVAIVEEIRGCVVGHEHVTVGVGLPGLVTLDGVLRAAPNLDDIADLDVVGELETRLGRHARRVIARNDATCATLAEHWSGAGVGIADMLLVTLGTGIGGGLVLGGELQLGHDGFLGEYGHMIVDPNGPPCPCGRRGCWERYASGSGLARLAREAAVGRRVNRVLELADGDPEAVRGEMVQQAASEGDEDARAIIDEFGRWVALGLANLTNALNPDVIVLGGGLAAGADLYLAPIHTWFRELLYQPDLRNVPDIRFASWGALAGAVGAALLPR